VGPRAGLDGRKISPPSGVRSPDRPAREIYLNGILKFGFAFKLI
jgi:hypothetical protein